MKCHDKHCNYVKYYFYTKHKIHTSGNYYKCIKPFIQKFDNVTNSFTAVFLKIRNSIYFVNLKVQ